jgi:cytochrome c553
MISRRVLAAAFILIASLAAGGLQAAGDPAKGAQLSTTCMGCHGIPGYRNGYPSYRVPKLGGQKPDYMVAALQDYRAQNRAHPTMYAQAATMSEQDLQDIAAFFASEGEPQTAATVAAGGAAAGKQKAAACSACHGEAGISSTPVWPNLAGQHEDYLVQALHEYQDGERRHPVMVSLAAALSKQDIKDLAAYFAAQQGLFTIQYKTVTLK